MWPELVAPMCTVGVTLNTATAALTPRDGHSCTVQARVIHRQAVELDEV